MIEENNTLKLPKVGEIIEGKIINKGKSSVFLNLENWGTGIIYGKEFFEAKNNLKKTEIGDVIFVKITDLENEEGYVELSLNKAGKELAWETLKQKKEKDEIIAVKIIGANKGGLLAEVMGISAFIPSSQLSAENYPKVEGGDNQKILKSLQKLIGKEMEVKIFDLDPKKEKLILSEKAKNTEKIKEILKNYKIGDVVKGEITGVVEFGAFMKFGTEELEGLIHISELDWQMVKDPGEIVKTGQKIKAKIIEISNNKICLSLKALEKDPWEEVEKKYKKGDIIKAKVTKLNSFGAFVQVSDKIQGLCHISEFGSQKKMEEALKAGQKYDFQILSVDAKEHRMSLKLA